MTPWKMNDTSLRLKEPGGIVAVKVPRAQVRDKDLFGVRRDGDPLGLYSHRNRGDHGRRCRGRGEHRNGASHVNLKFAA